jgi:signal transduction histidine kinase
LSGRAKIWLATVGGILSAFIVAAVFLPKSYGLAAICDFTDSLLLASGAASFVPLALRARGRTRLFWSLIILGLSMWLCYQLAWTSYEVVLRRDVPELFAGDIVLFLDIVPLMAALGLRPHAAEDEYSSRLGRLDFAFLLVWWLYLYVLIVIPWQYVQANIPAYTHDLDNLYFVEKLAYLAALAACWISSRGPWRKLYASLFGMSSAYVASSTIANWAISRHVYYSGSVYDVPLACAMAWITWIGLSTKVDQPAADAVESSTIYGVWIARSAMIAVFTLPLFAVWTISDAAIPHRIRLYRIVLTLGAAIVMGVMIFIRQQLLDRELNHLLTQSQESFDHLKQLQAQILQSEKVASVGQLVGGAAHELNNPITAMLGYSDLLLSTPLNVEQRPLAARIGQQVRRTKSLVASLISFARQTPAAKTPVDLNTLARTAVKLAQPQWEALQIGLHTDFDAELPKVLGDSNQLLQVCVQLLGNCLHVMDESGGKILSVSTRRGQGIALLEIAATAGPVENHVAADRSADAADADDGLSACQGILQEHRGQISRRQRDDGAVCLRVELPAIEAAAPRSQAATVPVLWQSQPFA